MAFLEFASSAHTPAAAIPPHIVIMDATAGCVAVAETQSHILLADVVDRPSRGLLEFLASPPAISVAVWGQQLPGAALAADVVVIIGAGSRRTGPELAPGLRPFVERRIGVERAEALLATARIWQPMELFQVGLADVLIADEDEFLVWLQKVTRKSIGEFGTYRARRRVHPILPADIDLDFSARS